jgi:hypothetical protein
MRRIVTRIAPWQSAKTLALAYFALGVPFAVLLGLLEMITPDVPGQAKIGLLFYVALPFIYGIAGLIFVPLGCLIYNKAAAIAGGVELNVETRSDA